MSNYNTGDDLFGTTDQEKSTKKKKNSENTPEIGRNVLEHSNCKWNIGKRCKGFGSCENILLSAKNETSGIECRWNWANNLVIVTHLTESILWGDEAWWTKCR